MYILYYNYILYIIYTAYMFIITCNYNYYDIN